MKLDPARRKAFINELAECENLREQARCVRRSIGHLKAKDARGPDHGPAGNDAGKN